MLTKDELIELLSSKNYEKIIKAFENLNEKERKGLFKHVKDYAGKNWSKNKYAQYSDKEDLRPQSLREDEHEDVMQLASVALGSKTQACSINYPYNYDENDGLSYIIKALRDRNPEWLADWAERMMRSDYFAWEELNSLVQLGLMEKPDSDLYYRLAAEAFSVKNVEKYKDPLAEDIYHFFSVEPPKEQYTQHIIETSSSGIFKELCEKNIIDRDRLLKTILQGLLNPFRLGILRNYKECLEMLEPTIEDWQNLQPELCDILGSIHSEFISYSLGILQKLHKENLLDTKTFFKNVESLYNSAGKGVALKFIKFLKSLKKGDASLGKDVNIGILTALIHTDLSIQESVCEYLESLTPQELKALSDKFENLEGFYSDSLKTRLNKLFKHEEESDESDFNWDEIYSELTEYDNSILEAFGFDKLKDSREKKLPLKSIQISERLIPRLSSENEIQPIQSFKELISEISTSIETVFSNESLERILDAISRLGVSEQNAALTGPLKKRMIQWDSIYGINLYAFFVAWLSNDSDYLKDEELKVREYSIEGFFNKRTFEIFKRVVCEKCFLPMLSAPTHKGGWIAPLALVERLLKYQEQSVEVPEYDFIQALLRLAPDGRDKALDLAKEIFGDHGTAIRWALDHNLELPTNMDYWLAAARSNNLGQLEHSDENLLKSGALRPIILDEATDDIFRFQRPAIDEGSLTKPTVLLALIGHYDYVEQPHRWATYIWPLNTHIVLTRVFTEYRFFDPMLDCLLDDRSNWFDYTPLMLGQFLIGEEICESEAVDILIDSAPKLLWDGQTLGTNLLKIYCAINGHQVLKPLTEALQKIVGESKLHRQLITDCYSNLICEVVEQCNSESKPFPRDIAFMLEALKENLLILEKSPDSKLREVLESFTGSNKSSKAAKAILKIKDNLSIQDDVYAHALQSMLERIKSALEVDYEFVKKQSEVQDEALDVQEHVEIILDEEEMTIHEALEDNNLLHIKNYLSKGGDPNLCDVEDSSDPFDIMSIMYRDKPLLSLATSREAIELLLEAGADMFLRKGGNFPFFKCDFDLLKAYLNKGLDVNYEIQDRGTQFTTLLHLYNDEDEVKELLKLGANPNLFSYDSPLHQAVKDANIKKCQLLIETGADVNALSSSESCSPLHMALGTKKITLLKLLLEHGADVNSLNCQGETPLQVLLKDPKKNEKSIKLLKENGGEEEAKIIPLEFRLYDKVNSRSSLVEIREILNQKPDLNKHVGRTPCLALAINQKNAELAKELIDAGADIDSVFGFSKGKSLVEMAVSSNCLDILKILVQKGADVNRINLYSLTNRPECTMYLLDNGFDPNTSDSNQKHLIHYAVESGNIELVEKLIDLGADFRRLDGYEKSPLGYAKDDHFSIVKLLCEAGVDPKDEKYSMLTTRNIDTLKFILNKGVEVDGDKESDIPLHFMIRNDLIEHAQLLINAGASLNLTDKWGDTTESILKEKGGDWLKFLG